MPYLVDTDVLIDVSRNNEAAIDFLDHLDDSWSMSIITALELIVGARNKKEVIGTRPMASAKKSSRSSCRFWISYE